MSKTSIMVILAVLLAAALAVPAAALAASPNANANAAQGQLLSARYDGVSARAGFVTGELSNTVTAVPQASDLNTWVSKLNGDLSTLQSYVSSSDNDGFNSYVSGTINPDMSSAINALNADRQQFKSWNVTPAARTKLANTDYQNLKSTCNARLSQATTELGQARLAAYNADISAADKQIASLSAKGIDTSAMQSIVAGAETSVVTPLQDAVNSGNQTLINSLLKSTCMYNGASYSYHLAAQLDLARLQAITAYITANATADGYGSQISGINAQLNSAQGLLAQIGTSPYTSGQESQYYGYLQTASSEIKTVIQDMNGRHAQPATAASVVSV